MTGNAMAAEPLMTLSRIKKTVPAGRRKSTPGRIPGLAGEIANDPAPLP